MVLFSTLFGCKNSGISNNNKNHDIYPKESFSVIEATLNGKPYIGSFNMAYANFPEKGMYPWCLSLSMALDLKMLYPNGLPWPEENKIANAEEDQLVSKIKKITTTQYIGHLFNDTFLDIYIYIDKPEKVHEFLQIEKDKKNLARGISYEIKQDPNWEMVQGFMVKK